MDSVASFPIRPATATDIPALERLMLANFPHLFTGTMGNAPDAVKLQVLIALRHARRDPVGGHFVATAPDGAVVAMLAYETHAMTGGTTGGRLAALRPLGWGGMVRFIGVAQLAFIHQSPDADEVYIRNGAVDSAYRRHGLALRLLQTIEAETAAQGYRQWVGWVASTNAASAAMMSKNGYAPTGTVRTFWRGKLLGEPTLYRYEKRVTG